MRRINWPFVLPWIVYIVGTGIAGWWLVDHFQHILFKTHFIRG